MKRTRQVAPPSQKPSTVKTLPAGEVSSTVSSVSGAGAGAAVALALKLCSQRPQRGTVCACTLPAKTVKKQNARTRGTEGFHPGFAQVSAMFAALTTLPTRSDRAPTRGERGLHGSDRDDLRHRGQ